MLLSIPLLLSVSPMVNAAVLQVTSTADNPGSPIPCTITANPSVYTCATLRDAILAANTLPGLDTITFNKINRADPANNCSIASGDVDTICKITIAANLATPTSADLLPTITDSVIIDGQIREGRPNIPGSVKHPEKAATKRPGIELSGEKLPLTATVTSGLTLDGANNSIIKGLVINKVPGPGIFSLHGSNMKVYGNYIGTDVTATIPSVWNAANTVCLSNCYGNRGSTANPALSVGYGVIMGQGDNIVVGGTKRDFRNVLANNFAAGATLFEVTNSAISGNFTGTDVYGLAAMGNRVEDVEIRGFTGAVRASFNMLPLFGTDVGSKDNRIDGNLVLDSKTRNGMRLLGRKQLFKTTAADPGVIILNAIASTTIVNNQVGTNLAGQSRANFEPGIGLSDNVTDTKMGFVNKDGRVTPAPNLVSNATGGVTLATAPLPIFINITGAGTVAGGLVAASGNAILYNSIQNSILGTLGIDLAGLNAFLGDGVTLNDLLDPDVGSNAIQNFPVLDVTNSFRAGDTFNVVGTLDSKANHQYLVQVFANQTANSTGYGEGQQFVGQTVVMTDANGHANFNFRANGDDDKTQYQLRNTCLAPTVIIKAHDHDCDDDDDDGDHDSNGNGHHDDSPILGNVLSATATDLVTCDTSEFGKDINVVVNAGDHGHHDHDDDNGHNGHDH